MNYEIIPKVSIHPNRKILKGASDMSGWTWTIALCTKTGKNGFSVQATIESDWRYSTYSSAKSAVMRWLKRLGLEVKPFVCPLTKQQEIACPHYR